MNCESGLLWPISGSDLYICGSKGGRVQSDKVFSRQTLGWIDDSDSRRTLTQGTAILGVTMTCFKEVILCFFALWNRLPILSLTCGGIILDHTAPLLCLWLVTSCPLSNAHVQLSPKIEQRRDLSLRRGRPVQSLRCKDVLKPSLKLQTSLL